jgi:hypothetical protein
MNWLYIGRFPPLMYDLYYACLDILSTHSLRPTTADSFAADDHVIDERPAGNIQAWHHGVDQGVDTSETRRICSATMVPPSP